MSFLYELFSGEQERIHNLCEDGIKKSVPWDLRLSSLGMPDDSRYSAARP